MFTSSTISIESLHLKHANITFVYITVLQHISQQSLQTVLLICGFIHIDSRLHGQEAHLGWPKPKNYQNKQWRRAISACINLTCTSKNKQCMGERHTGPYQSHMYTHLTMYHYITFDNTLSTVSMSTPPTTTTVCQLHSRLKTLAPILSLHVLVMYYNYYN